MRPTAVPLAIVLCASVFPRASGAPKTVVVPQIAARVVGLGDAQPQAGVAVELLVSSGKRAEPAPLGAATTGADGRVAFAARPAQGIDFVALRFAWNEPERPRRSIVYSFKAKKGAKTAAGRLVRPGKSEAPYLVADGDRRGDCDNLFELTESGDALHLLFRRPESYADCRETHVKHADVGNVGHRNLNAGALNLYSFDQDRAMGRQFVDRMGPDQPLLDDPLVAGYTTDLVERIARASDMPDLEVQVRVIDADVLNAFALPGGYVFVYRGLLEATENESELVGVLAHEMAHVTGRHGTEGLTSAMGKMVLAMVAGGVLADQLTDNETAQKMIMGAVMTGTNFWVLGGSRKREAEADRIGAEYAWRAGYDPRGLATFFAKLAEAHGGHGTRLDTLFSDHPSDAARVAANGEMVDYFLPRRDGLVTSSDAYRKVKARLAQLPPPKLAGKVAADSLFSAFKRVNEDLVWGAFLDYASSDAAKNPPPASDEEDGG